MPHRDIIDNQDRKLSEEINDRLGASQSVKFATGYLYLSGFYEIAERLGELKEVRILVGDTLNRETIETLAQSLPGEEELQQEFERSRFENQEQKEERISHVTEGIEHNISGLPHSLDKEEKLNRITGWVREGKIQIKVFTREPLHAKAYIFKFKPEVAQGANSEGIGIIGSSNLTLSGFTLNSELNTYVRGPHNYSELNAWFDRLWKQAEPFQETIQESLQESWALKTVNPYDVYIMSLYHLVEASLKRQTEQIWFWTDEAFMERLRDRFEGFEDFYSFQRVAIMQAVNTISDYSGVFISDVVGLGKTFIGAGLIKQLGQRAVILSPAGLTEMWQDFAEAFEVDAKVISQGMLYHGEFSEESSLYPYRERPVVLIDESHNFRNNDTQKFAELQPFLAGKKVILMTATPQNTSVWNIYNQIKLFHQDEANPFPVAGSNIYSLFKEIEDGNFRIQAMLKYVLIRRTRAHIKKYYQDEDDLELEFPDRIIDTVTYDIGDLYNNLYDQILSLLNRLTYARYDLWKYVNEEKQNAPPYIDLKKVMGTLMVFHKIRLFRRLESSIAAFRQSIDNLLMVHQRVLRIINEKGIVPAGKEIQDRIYRYDEEQLKDYLETMRKQPYIQDDFRIGELKRDLARDIDVLDQIKRYLSGIPEEKDPKYEELKMQIKELQRETSKVLIFSEFADTVKYIGEKLAGDFDEVDIATGDTGNLLKKIGAFAPKANRYKGDQRIDIMVATDVLSEGHNLQDCSAIINYDLHWNPVRLIQRAGRVDRIGSEADEIFVRNFLPVDRVEQEINIKDILRRRIDEIHRYIGEDAQILEKDEQLNDGAMYTIYDIRNIDELEEDEEIEFSFDEAESLIRELEDAKPEYMNIIQNLQFGLRSAKAAKDFGGTYAFFRQGNFPKLFIKKPDGEVIDSFTKVINEIRCTPDDDEITLENDEKVSYYRDLEALKTRFKHIISTGQTRERPHTTVRDTKRRLMECVDALDGEEIEENANKIDRVLTAQFPRQYIGDLQRINAMDLSAREYFNSLVDFYNQYNLGSMMIAEDQEEKGDPIEFICGEVLK